jgi:hypothetical protein
MKKTVKIQGANKGVKKEFKTIKEAEKHIDENELFPANKDKPIQLEITQVKYHEVHRDSPELSEPIKETLIKTILDNLDKVRFSNMLIAGEMHDIFMHNGKSLYGSILYDLVKKKFNVSDADMKKYYKKYPWDDGGIKPPFDEKLHDNIFLNGFGNGVIKELFEKTNPNDIKFRYNSTNYKPCNNISIEFDNNILQIRAEDILFNEGRVYGRNVSLKRSVDLTDIQFETFFKTTKWAKA